VETKLTRIAKAAKMRPNEKFTSLIHVINEEMLKECHKEMQNGKAPGVPCSSKKDVVVLWYPLGGEGYFRNRRLDRPFFS